MSPTSIYDPQPRLPRLCSPKRIPSFGPRRHPSRLAVELPRPSDRTILMARLEVTIPLHPQPRSMVSKHRTSPPRTKIKCTVNLSRLIPVPLPTLTRKTIPLHFAIGRALAHGRFLLL